MSDSSETDTVDVNDPVAVDAHCRTLSGVALKRAYFRNVPDENATELEQGRFDVALAIIAELRRRAIQTESIGLLHESQALASDWQYVLNVVQLNATRKRESSGLIVPGGAR